VFYNIFSNELSYWFKRPAFYIYAIIFLAIGLFSSGASAGLFDSITATVGSSRVVNSPYAIFGLFAGLSSLIIFLYPSIIGVSIYRDYKSDVHYILYSYPFTKTQYLFAKFLSGVFIVHLIIIIIAFSISLGFILPGTNPDLLKPFELRPYIDVYIIYILPNLIFSGLLIFGVVTFTRNISAGFIFVLVLIILQGFLVGFSEEVENRFFSALIDPFGDIALQYYTQYWTVAEQNELYIPIKGVVIYNRLIWLGVSATLFGFIYRSFSFSQNPISFSLKKKKLKTLKKHNFLGIINIDLPKVNLDFRFFSQLKLLNKLSNVDFLYIFKSIPFVCIVLFGLLINILSLFETGNIFGTATLPRTWRMLQAGETLALSINICTFLYAGMLIHRSRIFKSSELIDTTPVKNWVLFGSKFLAIIKMQMVLLSLVMISGLIFQISKGFYDFELNLYVYELLVLSLIYYIIWAFLSFLVQTLISNPYLGLFIMIVLFIGIPLTNLAGVEQSIYKYSQGPGYSYSDMNGYGSTINRYFVYKIYWVCLGVVFYILTLLFYNRGVSSSFFERFTKAKKRFNGWQPFFISTFTVLFFSIGGYIYYINNIKNVRKSSKEREIAIVEWEKKYKKFEKYAQPRIVSVNVNVNLFPKTRDFEASGNYVMINKSGAPIDSLFLDHSSRISTFEFDKPNSLVLEDTIYHFDIYHFKDPILPGDSLKLNFTVKNKRNTLLRNNSPILSNGTFINNSVFPSLGYPGGELTDDKTREKYELPPNKLKPHPSDTTALGNTYISSDSDWIDFEAIVSTDKEQIAIAPGYLQKEWVEGDRRYFHYKMDSKILNFYAFNSAKYQVKKDTWKDVDLEIYYHKGHEYNLDRMMKGMKSALEYCSTQFSPYQHRQMRIVEFPRILGSFAQSFPNTVPFSEGVGFIADVDDSSKGGNDYPFYITAHEVAHQWFAHQVIGADVLGATVMSESLSEYVALKIIERVNGKNKMRKFLKKALDDYLSGRTFETKRENALMYNDGQGYIHYQKGSLVFYALSDYLGEKKLNNTISKYVKSVAFQEPPYTTTLELLDYLKEETPDSLQYVLKDMFETITLYDNNAVSATSKKLKDGKFQVDFEFTVSKYRNDEKGKINYGDREVDSIFYQNEDKNKPFYSVYLEDYIDIGVFGIEEEEESELYLEKHKISAINNTVSIIVDKEPIEVGIDPYNKLIDTDSGDNRKRIKSID